MRATVGLPPWRQAWHGGLVCLALSGCADRVDQQCAYACDLLDGCGMLPSALGVGNGDGDDDCKRRCMLSSESVRRPILDCVDAHRVASGESSWCSAGQGCREVSTCLAQHTDDPLKVLGRARLKVRLQAVEAESDVALAADQKGACAHATGNDSFDADSSADPQALCTAAGVSEVEFVLQSETSASPVGRSIVVPCVFAFGRGVEHVDLPPGLYVNYVRLRGTEVVAGASDAPVEGSGVDAGSPRSLAAAQPYCRTVHGERRLLRANTPRLAVVGVPILPNGFDGRGWFPCENTEEACSDGLDNDGNDLADCAEQACASFCEEPPCALGQRDASSCVSELQ